VDGPVSGVRRRRRLIAWSTLVLTSGCTESPPPTQQTVAGGDARRGARLIAAYGCGSCHAIPGVPGARGNVGPPLTAFAERTYIAGALRNEPVALVRWIRFPQFVEPGTAMPDLGVTEQQARDIAAYLYTLGRGGLGPPHLIPARVLPTH
jgi:cytochrome c